MEDFCTPKVGDLKRAIAKKTWLGEIPCEKLGWEFWGCNMSPHFEHIHLDVEPKKRGFYPPKWMVKIMENPIEMDDLGVPLFLETPISRKRHCPSTSQRFDIHNCTVLKTKICATCRQMPSPGGWKNVTWSSKHVMHDVPSICWVLENVMSHKRSRVYQPTNSTHRC